MPPKFLVIALLVLFAAALQAQTVPVSKDKAAEDEAKLDKAAVELLRDTSVEVGRLRTMENRISFNAELASLMWFHDDKEARGMYSSVVTDFKQLLSQLDADMNSPAGADEDAGGGIGFFGGYGKSKAERKLRAAMEVRKQIATSLADHAPDLAFSFFYDSLSLISNAEFRKSQEATDKYFEIQLIQQIAQSNAAKGVEFGKEAIKKGLDSNHIELLKKIYASDADKGVEFGAAILSRIKSDDAAQKNIYLLGSLLTFGDETLDASKGDPKKKPVYERSDLRDLAELLAAQIMKAEATEYYPGGQYVSIIEEYAPGRAAQIRARFKNLNSNGVVNTASNSAMIDLETAPMMANSNTAASRAIEESQAREKAQTKMLDDIKDLGNKPLPKEERDKIIAQSRKIIAQTPGKDKKLTVLSLLAAQVARAGDKELANEIMGDAERYVNPQPKNYQDFLMTWLLASGYAEANPDKAFPLLETAILRANETLSAFIKVAEFIDINDEMIDDGEVQVGMFGGSMMRELTGELGMADSTIKTLAKADFAKTVNLTNTFDRTEIRVLAKMLVLRAVMADHSKIGPVRDDIGG
jgi:hypothetical protein